MTYISFCITSGGEYLLLVWLKYQLYDWNTGCITIGDAKFDQFLKGVKMAYLHCNVNFSFVTQGWYILLLFCSSHKDGK